MSEKVIASLVGRLRFDADNSGLLKFERLLDQVARKMAQLERQAQRLNRKLGIAPKGNANIQKQIQQQQRLTKQQFADSLKASKLQLAVDQQQLKSQNLQSKLSQQQAHQAQAEHRAQLQQLKTSQAAHQYSIRQEQSRLKLQQEQLRTSAAQSRLEATRARTQAASDRARIQAMKLEERINKRLPGGMRSPSGRAAPPPSQSIWRGGGGFGSSIRHAASAGLGAGVGVQIPGMNLFRAGLHPVAMGLGAVAAAAVAAQAKLNELGKQDIAALDTRRVERANLLAATGSPEAATKVEQRLSKFADELGLVRAEIQKPYTSALLNMSQSGMNIEQATTTLEGIMAFGRGSGVSVDDQAGALRAVIQVLSKGQAMAEETRGQIAERMPGAWTAMAEAWAETTKSGLIGDKAVQRFGDDMSKALIRGDKLPKWLEAYGRISGERANLGGRLDAARQSSESAQARIVNMQERRSIAVAEYDNGALKRASAEMYEARERLQTSLEKLIPGFSTLESASLRLETRFVDGSTRMVLWIEKLQTKINELTSDPRAVAYLDQIGAKFDQFITHIEPLFDLLTDVVTFIGNIAFETVSESFDTFLSRMDEVWTALEPILGEVPEAFDFLVTQLRTIIDRFFETFGLGDRWRKHVEQRNQEDTGISTETRMPFLARPAPLIPEAAVSALDRWTQTPAQAMQQLIDSSTTNTNNVVTNQFHVQVNASGANAEEVANQLTDRFQQMASDAARGVFDTTLRVTKANYGQVKQ